MSTLETPLSAAAVSVVIQGESIAVAPAKLGQLLAVLQLVDSEQLLDAVTGLFAEASGPQGVSPAALLSVLARHGDGVVACFGLLLNRSPEWLKALDLDDVLVLFTAAAQVNADFFTTRLKPRLTALTSKIISTLPSEDSTPKAEGKPGQSAPATA